jgi:hypothetical protein
MEDKCLPLFWNIITNLFPKNNNCRMSSFEIDDLMHSICNTSRNTSNMVGAMAFVSSDILCLCLCNLTGRVWTTSLFKKFFKTRIDSLD